MIAPAEHNIKIKEILNKKYTDIQIEVIRMWDIQDIIVLYIIGALASTPRNLKKIEIASSIQSLQKSALPVQIFCEW